MATRTISTRLVIEGEAEYRQSIKNCNSELAVMKSQLALVTSQYSANANSMEALRAKGDVLAAMYGKQKEKADTMRASLESAKAAQAKLSEETEKARANLEAAQKKMAALGDSSDGTSESQKALAEETARLAKELEVSEAKQNSADKSVNTWQKSVNYAERDLKKFGDRIDENDKYLKEAEKSFQGTATGIDRFGKQTKGAGDAVNTLAGALAAAGVAASVKEIASSLADCAKASIAFESAITGVYKTVDGTEEQLAAISDGIKKMSTEMPATTTEIAAVAEAAGQLGIKTEDITSFTKTMVNLGVATNLTAGDAATLLAQFANITGMDAANYEALGSTIVALGNNFATTESKIVEMAQGMASAASIAGFSETDIMGVSAAVSSLGIESEAGSSAVSRLVGKLQVAVETGDGLEEFARVAGMSGEAFQKSWGESAVGAMSLFIKGLGDTERTGSSAIVTLDKMGITDVRLKNTILALSNSGDLLTNAVEKSSGAWQANNALSEEAGKRYATTESQLTLCKNAATNFKMAIGDELAPALADLAGAGADGFQWAADFVADNPWVVSAIAVLVDVLAVLVTGIAGLKIIQVIIPLIKGFNAALASNPVGAVVFAITTLVTVLGTLAITTKDAGEESAKSYREMTEAAREAKKTISDSKKAYDDTAAATVAAADIGKRYTSRLAELEKQGLKTKKAQMEYAGIVEKLNALMPDLNLTINEQTGLLEQNTDSIYANIDSLKEQALAQARMEKNQEIMRAWTDATIELAENQRALNVAVSDEQEARDAQAAALGRLRDMEAEAAANHENAYYDQEYQDLTQTVQDYEGTIYAAQQEQNKLNEAISSGREVAASAEEELDAYTQAQRNGADATAGAVDITGTLRNKLDEASKAYEDAAVKARASIDSQIGQWEKMDNSVKTSAKTLNDALLSQISYLESYTKNLDSLSGRNIEGVDKLVQSLADGSAESAAILSGLATASDDEIKEVVKNLGKVDEGKEKFSKSIAGVSKEFTDAMNAVVLESDRYTEMYGTGSHTIQGMIMGAESKRRALISEYASIARAAAASVRKELDMHSPSKLFAELGKNTIDGFIIGVEDKEKDLAATMKQAVDLATEAFGMDNEKAVLLAQDFLSAYNDSLSYTAAQASALADVTTQKLGEVTDAMEEVEKKQSSMQEKLSKYGDLFHVESKSGYMNIENLDAQNDALLRYEKTLTGLRNAGIDQGLLDEVVGMGVDEATKYGEKLLQMMEFSPEKWEAYNATWAEKQDTAKRIAKEFYQGELDSLKGEYTDLLAEGLGDMKTVSFKSGQDTIKGLIDGLKDQKADLYTEANAIATQLRSIISGAMNTPSKSKPDGSHAKGLPYVPFDGYTAELHKGERVLTADETRHYIEARTPASFDIAPRRQMAQEQTEAMVNAIATLTAGTQTAAQDGPATIILKVGHDTEIARWLLPSIREASKQSPEVERDF